MIDEKGLLHWLRDYQFEFFAGVGCEKEYNFIENLIKGIENEPKVGEWIPCSERLPSAGRKVLLQTKGNQMVVAFLDKKNKWYVDSGDYFCTDLCAEPIAWQPLPESYKE